MKWYVCHVMQSSCLHLGIRVFVVVYLYVYCISVCVCILFRYQSLVKYNEYITKICKKFQLSRRWYTL